MAVDRIAKDNFLVYAPIKYVEVTTSVGFGISFSHIILLITPGVVSSRCE